VVEVKVKNLFRGTFNFNKQIFCEYSYAYTKEQAKIVMARRIAKKQEVLPVVVLSWLKDHSNSYEINIEVDFKEVD
jgi:hypothetical protein